MKKYNIKIKRNGHTFGEYNSKEEASDKLIKFINDVNSELGGDYLSPSDYVIEEVECKEVSEVITDFETARKCLCIKPLDGIIVSKRLEGVERLVREINPKHIEALVALNKLFTIAEAWNNADGFEPDFSDWHQDKYFPWFEYENKVAGFVCTSTYKTGGFAGFHICSRICFKTHERAEQFGKQFADLYNKVFL